MLGAPSCATAGHAGGRCTSEAKGGAEQKLRHRTLEELEPCPDREGAEAYVGEVADIDDAARTDTARGAGRTFNRRNDCREAHVEASELRAAVIKHKHHPWSKRGERHLHAEAPDYAIPVRGIIDSASRDCRARAESGASIRRGIVACRVRERALDLRAGPAHGGVGHDACIAQWNHEAGLKPDRAAGALGDGV